MSVSAGEGLLLTTLFEVPCTRALFGGGMHAYLRFLNPSVHGDFSENIVGMFVETTKSFQKAKRPRRNFVIGPKFLLGGRPGGAPFLECFWGLRRTHLPWVGTKWLVESV